MDNPTTSKNSRDTDQLLHSNSKKLKKKYFETTIGQQLLEFVPHAKRKKHVYPNTLVSPFPSCASADQTFTGIFTGISVEICDQSEMHAIYESGCFGKGSQSRSAPKLAKTVESSGTSIHETLSLDLEESFFLANYLKVLRINDLDGHEIDWQKQLQAFEKIKPSFIECFVAYMYLKSKNWVVKGGIKFGGDFLIYKNSLRQYHASFIVFVNNSNAANANLRPKDIKGIQRIAETSDKDILLLEIAKPTEDFIVDTLEDIKLCRISETIIRRFNYSAFVQSHNK